MKRTKQEQYRFEIRSIARQLEGNHTYSRVVMENITHRTEKTFIKNYMKSVELDIKHGKKFGADITRFEKVLRVLKSRLAVIESNS